METHFRDTNVLWSPDLTVGSDLLDKHNQEMFDQLAAVEHMVSTSTPEELSSWLANVMDQLAALLMAEENELASVDYPELVFHRSLHARAHIKIQAAQAQLHKCPTGISLTALARETCNELAVWLMRHVQDADKLFFPYVDVRYRKM